MTNLLLVVLLTTQGLAEMPPLPCITLGLEALPGTTHPIGGPVELTKKELLAQIFTETVKKQFFIADYPQLEKAWNKKELVAIADDPGKTGVKLRKKGKWPIAEMERNKKRKPKYWGLRKPAAGLLYQIGDHMKGYSPPLEVTSLVRSWAYQRLLMRRNPTANTTKQGVPPTHVYGLAFDIAWSKLNPASFNRLESYLKELSAAGKIVYFREQKNQAAFHVIALPKAHKELVAYYEATTSRFNRIVAANSGGEKN